MNKRGSYAEKLLDPKRDSMMLDKDGPVTKLDGLLNGVPNASQLPGVTSGKPMANNSTTIENNIGEIKVYTQATDAEGIAKDIGASMDFLKTSQANYGSF